MKAQLLNKRFLIGMAWGGAAVFLLATPTAVTAKGRIHATVHEPPQVRTVNQDYTYTTNNRTITITGYTGLGGAVIIPGTINSLPVTRIGDNAFFSCNKLANVTLSNGVTSIGNNAFRSCTGLTSMVIPPGVTRIEDLAFACCSSLATVTLPDSVTHIGDSTFSYCTSLTNLMIPKNLTIIRCGLFQYCIHLTHITIPGTVTTLQSDAFLGCKNLKEVHFNGNAPQLGSHVFDGSPATLYYRPGTSGWGAKFGDRPATTGE